MIVRSDFGRDFGRQSIGEPKMKIEWAQNGIKVDVRKSLDSYTSLLLSKPQQWSCFCCHSLCWSVWPPPVCTTPIVAQLADAWMRSASPPHRLNVPAISTVSIMASTMNATPITCVWLHSTKSAALTMIASKMCSTRSAPMIDAHRERASWWSKRILKDSLHCDRWNKG